MALTQVDQGLLAPQAQYTGFKNRIINGAMVIDQRNAGASISSGVGGLAYPCDRMFVFATGAAVTAQRTGSAGAYAITVTGAASNTIVSSGQRIESVNIADCAGSAITISLTLSASTAQTFAWSATVPTATDNYTSTATIASGTFAVTTTPTVFTATIAAGSTSTLVRGMQFAILPNNAGAFTSGTFTYTNLQIETGSTATSFDYRPYGAELALCQRYYAKTFSQGTAPAQNTSIYAGCLSALTGASAFTGNATVNWRYPVTMRAVPTIGIYTPGATGTGRFSDSGGGSVAASATNTGDASTMIYSSGGAANVNSYAYVHATATAEL